jgi:DNA-binding CsgD family transcriptional regulator
MHARGAGHRLRQRLASAQAGLAERELEILIAVERGEPNPKIAKELGISAKVVGHHVQHVYLESGVRCRAAGRLLGLRATTSFTLRRAFALCGAGVRSVGSPHHRRRAPAPRPQRRRELILATTKVEDFDRFLKIFSTKGAEKRKQHGSKGSSVFRDPNEDDRVWVLFDWDAEGWQSFVSDPEVPAILQEAGHQGRPQAAELGGQYDA